MSEKVNFTPGQWIAICERPSKRNPQGTAMVATPVNQRGALAIDCAQSGKSHDESMANARLVASAPDLYAALEGFMSLDKTFYSASDDYLRECSDEAGRDFNPLARVVLLARAALAKARGE